MYIADDNNHLVRRFDPETGLLSTVLGAGISTEPAAWSSGQRRLAVYCGQLESSCLTIETLKPVRTLNTRYSSYISSVSKEVNNPSTD